MESSTWLGAGAVAIMLIAVDVDGGCWEVVLAEVGGFRRWMKCLPRIVFKQMPLRQAHRAARIRRSRTATPSDSPMSRWSMNDTWEDISRKYCRPSSPG